MEGLGIEWVKSSVGLVHWLGGELRDSVIENRLEKTWKT